MRSDAFARGLSLSCGSRIDHRRQVTFQHKKTDATSRRSMQRHFCGASKSSSAIVAEHKTLPIKRTISVSLQNGQANAARDGLGTAWKQVLTRPDLASLVF